jgi:sigma-E processing peptidase SpoIIGA
MINFSMDFLCFFIAVQLLSEKLKLFRTLLAAALGGIYACVALFLPITGIWAIVLDAAVCFLMCVLAFGTAGIFLHTVVYFAISMILGGFMSALFALLNKADLGLESVEGDGISAWVLAILAIISAAFALAGTKFFKKKTATKYASVELELCGQSKSFRAFCDSGNLLRDPISGRVCVLVCAESLKGMVSNDVIDIVRTKNVAPLASTSAEMVRRVRIIPAHTATGDGCLVAIRPDRVLVGEDGEAPTKEVDALLALSEAQSFNDECEVLLPNELLI